MAYGFSAYLANSLLQHAFKSGTTWTPPTTIYAQLHTGDPGAAGTANDSTSARIAVAFSAAASGSIPMTSSVDITLSASETIVGVSFWDALTGGNFLYSVQVTTSKAGISGDIIRLLTNSVSMTPLAA